MATATKKKEDDANLLDEILKLKKELAEIKQSKKEEPTTKITDELDVPVVSCVQGVLNLATEGIGQGIIYTFSEIGEIIDIPFYDLKNIVKNNKRFAKESIFKILDKDIEKKLRVRPSDGGFDIDKLQDFLSLPPNTILEEFFTGNKAKQDTIYAMIVDALLSGEDVDANVKAEIGQYTGYELFSIRSV